MKLRQFFRNKEIVGIQIDKTVNSETNEMQNYEVTVNFVENGNCGNY